MNKYMEVARRLQETFEQAAMELCDLDRKAGDGDHGLTISRGFRSAYEQVSLLDEDAAAAEVFKAIGYGMLNTMGGASGPIFSTFFIQAAIVLNERKVLDGEALTDILEKTITAIHNLADTRRGEKTMLDALYGAVDAIQGEPRDAAIFRKASEGAKQGAEATRQMQATKGRAKFLQERSIGFMDAGSWSVYLILDTIAAVLGDDL